MTDPLAARTGDRVTFPETFLRGSRLLLLGILLAPLVVAGYVGLTVLLFLPLLGLRTMFPRRSMSSVCWDDNSPLDSGVVNLWDAATRRARQ
jgi:hypothetical protein